jgi:hypothetical protein
MTFFYVGQKVRAVDLNGPACIVTRSTAQTGIVTATPTVITFDTEAFDNASMFTTSLPTEITITRAGNYTVSAYAGIESNATGYRRLLIEQNGGSNYVVIDERPAVNGDATHMTIGTFLSCQVNDKLKLFIEQSSGGNRSTVGTPRLCVAWHSG